MPVRSPIGVVMGHIDVGKTSLLDKIRGTAVQQREAGGITQHIGASFFPIQTIKQIAGSLLDTLKVELRLPGLLIIDTPGHEAFMNLRSRGGAIADIAILVVDINKSFQPQTYESIRILKSQKTPFLVAANMLDRVHGWQSTGGLSFLQAIKKQPTFIQNKVNELLYVIMGDLSREGFNAERFDRVIDFTNTIAIVPTSAKTGEGIAELLAVVTGLTQQYMQERLTTTDGPGKGAVLEIKEEPGLGVTLDVIIYDGVIRQGDQIVVGGLDDIIVTKIRALLQPKPLDEIRDPRQRFSHVREVVAAAGVKISAPDLEGAIAGAPLRVVGQEDDLETVKNQIKSEIASIRFSTKINGVILKADALGSLEALVNFFEKAEVPVHKADVGDVSKSDVMEAVAVRQKEPFLGVVICFNTKILADAQQMAEDCKVKIFSNTIIYRLLEDYQRWVADEKEKIRSADLVSITRPGIIKLIPDFIFRRSKPAVVGVDVIAGFVKPKQVLINGEGERVGTILQIQDRNETLKVATKGMQVAISISGPTIGRQ
ncbi:MAG: translation initiation factor IF-2, partial [Candidatus Ranarchaeia archaeon]